MINSKEKVVVSLGWKLWSTVTLAEKNWPVRGHAMFGNHALSWSYTPSIHPGAWLSWQLFKRNSCLYSSQMNHARNTHAVA